MTKEILTRDGIPTEELHETVTKIYEGVEVTYEQCYYLDFHVDESTGRIDKSKKSKYYTQDQVERNLFNLMNKWNRC